MIAILLVVGMVCIIMMINFPGALGNFMIWVVALGVIIGASCALGPGGFIIATPIAIWIARSSSRDRAEHYNRQEQLRLAARRQQGLKWFE